MINPRLFVVAAVACLSAGCGLSEGPASQPPPSAASEPAGPQTRLTGKVDPARIPSQGRKYMLAYDSVTCASPIALGVARTIFPHSQGSDYQQQVFTATHCDTPDGGLTLPPIVAPEYFEDVTWRATFDGGDTWVGGALRVAAVRGKETGGQEVTTFIAQDDLLPVGGPPARASTSKPGA